MKSHSHSQKKSTDSAFIPQVQAQLQSRPWAEPTEAINPDLESPEVQMEPETREGLGHNLANISIFAPTPPPESPELPPLQMKGLTIGKPGDKYEQEADTVARKVVSQINRAPLTQGRSEETEEVIQPKLTPYPFLGRKSDIQRSENIGGGEASTELTSEINSAKGGGQPLHEPLRMKMEQAMGTDFSGVKVHHDPNADTLNRSLSARAFTTGEHIFFKQGEYQPESRGGQELIAHELTHVMQQGGGTVLQKKTDLPEEIKIESVNVQNHVNKQVQAKLDIPSIQLYPGGKKPAKKYNTTRFHAKWINDAYNNAERWFDSARSKKDKMFEKEEVTRTTFSHKFTTQYVENKYNYLTKGRDQCRKIMEACRDCDSVYKNYQASKNYTEYPPSIGKKEEELQTLIYETKSKYQVDISSFPHNL